MALRFRRSIKLAPGVRMNFTGSGLSWTFGPRGASIGVGRRGTFLNAGIPGTGLYARQRVSGGARQVGEPVRRIGQEATVSVSDDGVLTFTDEHGAPLSDSWVALGKKQHGDAIKKQVEGKVEELNASVEALGEVHLSTPPPLPPTYPKEPFEHARPSEPEPHPITFWARLFRRKRERIEAANAAARAE